MFRRFLACFDNPGALLAVVVTALLSLGIIMVYSASAANAGADNAYVAERSGAVVAEAFQSHHGATYFFKQAIWALIGVIVASIILYIPLETIEKYAIPILIVSFILLMLVSFTPLGLRAKGATRWIGIGPFTLQPVEFAKIGLVIFIAKFLADKRERVHELVSGFLPSVGILALFCALIMLQKDLGMIVLVGTVVLGMWCLAQVRFAHLATLVMLAIPALVYMVFQHSYRIRRIMAFLYPDQYATTEAFQLNQSLLAIGSSGIFGPGLGFGLQKYHYLAESHTDFIFAIVAEELGMIGALAVVLLFVAYILLGLRISYRAVDYFSGLLAAGLTLLIGCAAFINFFVVLGLAPTKGLALPFLSYGGSSLLAGMIATALLINISNETLKVRGSQEVF